MDIDRIIDISIDYSSKTIVYPGDPRPKLYWKVKIADGEPSNTGFVEAGLHHGTHVDVPIHFDTDRDSLEKVSLDRWIGKCLVIDCTHLSQCVARSDLEKVENLDSYQRVLLKTQNSLVYLKEAEFNNNFIYIAKDAAEYLVEKGMTTVGLDYITIDRYASSLDAHKTLLLNDVVIIESINLEHVDPGEYLLLCAPIKIPHMDGAPARALLYRAAVT